MLRNIPFINPLQMAQRSFGMMATHIGYLIKNQEVVQTEWAALSDYTHEHRIRPVISGHFPLQSTTARAPLYRIRDKATER